jgi:PAS domain S-box-containing protein
MAKMHEDPKIAAGTDPSLRERAEQQVWAMEIEAIYASAPVGLCVLDTDLRFVRVNERFAEINGVSISDHIGRTVGEVVPDLAGAAENLLRKVIATGEPVRNAEISGETPAQPGVLRTWVEHWLPLKDRDGRVVGINIVATEITDRKRIEEELRHRAEMFQRLIDTVPVMIVIFDPKLQRFQFNRALREILGWSEEDAVEGDFMAKVYPDQEYRAKVSEFMQSLESGWRDWKATAKDGSVVESSWSNISLSDDTWIGIGIDLRERKGAEEALLESEERFRLLTENASDVVIILDAEGNISYVSPSAMQVGGYAPADLIGRSILGLVHPEDRLLVINALQHAAVRPKERITLEVRVRHTSGEWLYMDVIGVNLLEEAAVRGIVVNARDVTERKRAEEAMRESEERFRLALRNSPVSVAAQDRDLRYVWAYNQRSVRPDQLIGHLDHEIFTAEEAAHFTAIKRRVLEEGIEQCEQIWLDRPTGRMYLDIIWEPIRDRDGRIIGVASATVDLTTIKLAEEALRENEEKYRLLFDNSIDGILLTEPDGTILAANHGACRMLGRTEEEIRQAGRSGIVDMDDPKIPFVLEERARTGKAQSELTFIRKDGTRFKAEVSSALFKNRDGRTQTSMIFRDITERKRAEEALRESEEKFRQLFESMGEGFVLHEMVYDDGRPVDYLVLDINPAYEKITGLQREQVKGKGITEIIPVIEPIWFERYDEVARLGRAIRFEDYNVGLDRWYSIYAFPMHKENQFAVIFTDITERKRAEEALQRRTDDLVRLNQEVVAARDEASLYLDIMTHDVRNANNVSSMYADLLADLAQGDLKTYVEKLHDSIERSSEILKNVATIRRAHEEFGRLVPVNLDAVIRGEIGNSPGATIRYDDLQVEVLADNLLPMVFTNLISNAVKFGGPAVEIIIRVRERDGEVEVSVEDTGPGVPDHDKEAIFQRFERGHVKGRGEGLGLFIARTLVERYDGRIWIEDRLGGHPECGAAFRFTLRRAGEER